MKQPALEAREHGNVAIGTLGEPCGDLTGRVRKAR